MLESVYLSLIGVSFILLVSSLIIDKPIAKLTLAGIAAFIFAVIAFSSSQVEVVSCTSVSCITQTFFYEENVWIFYGLSTISTILSLIFVFITIAKFRNTNAEEDI